MKKIGLQILSFVVATLLLPSALSAQSNDEALYKSLSESAARLTASEDSLSVLLTRARQLYAEDNGKAAQAEIILDLESKIFSLHSSIDDVAAQLRKLEQKGVSASVSSVSVTPEAEPEIADDRIFNSAGGADRTILVENKYFADNLPADVYASL